MSNDLVTAVIPTYNYGRFVAQAVESALAQTYGNVEVIVVDDGSKDDTRERLAPYMDRIRYIYQENQSVAAARNTGVRAARGAFIALLDADDLWHPQKLEFQMRYLADHPVVGLVSADAITDVEGLGRRLDDRAPLRARPVRLDELVIRPRFSPSSALVRKECFHTAGFFDAGLRNAEDYDLWIRIACHFPVVKLELPLWWYRVHGANKSYVPEHMELAGLKILGKLFARGSPLSKRFFLKRKAYSFVAYYAALDDRPGMERRAFARLVRSFLFWPFPYRRNDVSTALARPKRLVILLLRMLRGLAATPPAGGVHEPGPVQPAHTRQAAREGAE